MSTATVAAGGQADKAEQLPDDVREALRDLLLALADGKRLLGIRYSDWMLGAPTIEAGIAASSMAQDEWGHSRLTYALLSDFGDEPKSLEHERDAGEYRSPELLDGPFASWAQLIAAALILDTAFSVQYDALTESRYQPARNRVQKMLDEERFHFQHAAGWARRLALADAVRDEFLDGIARMLPVALRWFGPAESAAGRRLAEEGVVRGDPEALRDRFLASVGPVLAEAGIAEEVGLAQRDGEWGYARDLAWDGWKEARRRASDGGPDADTLSRVRGDRNRAFLMD
jgi:ring-1,2-phenylacetyl-CoA epoxidase subunit PaaC